MPKTKKKTTKTPKNPSKVGLKTVFYKSMMVFFATTTICLAGIAIFLFLNRQSPLDEKKSQISETLLKDYFRGNPLVSDKDKQLTRTTPIGIGVSKDNDLYVEFAMLRNDEDDVPLYTRKGVMYFQCKGADGKMIGTDKPSSCARAVSYEEPVYIENTIREKIKAKNTEINTALNEYYDNLKRLYGPENYKETESGIELDEGNFTEEQKAEHAAITKEFTDKIDPLEEELGKTYEEFWKYK